MENKQKHFLLITHGATSHLNPTLQFSKNLISTGAKATILLTLSAFHRLHKSRIPDGLFFETFSDGYDDGAFNFTEIGHYLAEFHRRGSQALHDMLSTRSFTCVVHTLLISWVITVARDFHVPTAALWIQCATVFDICYYYFNGYGDIITRNKNDFSFSIQFPGLPLLTNPDLPSFLISDLHGFVLKQFEEKFEIIEKETNFTVLINSFDELEHDALSAISKLNLIPIGPLAAFSSESDASFGADLDLMNWLDSTSESSIVYISFGSICKLPKKQKEEIANGLLEYGSPFLWVIRANENEDEEGELSCLNELEELGKIVQWCSQLDVLCHPSLGCFVTHCGWNSTIESVAAGIRMQK